MIGDQVAPIVWRKSTKSHDTNCIEVAFCDKGRTVFVRDSKKPDGGTLSVSSSAWQEFIEAIRHGPHPLG